MDYGIVSRIDSSEALKLAQKIIEYVSQYTEIQVEESTAQHLELSNKIDSVPMEEMNIETLITVGGDGTILRAMQKIDAQVFAVNMGRVGFLTEVPGEDVEKYLDRLLDGDYLIDQRSKLRTVMNNRELVDAVNETVIHTAQISKLRDFNILIDNVLAVNIRSDGLIVATPTGSTCYAMSAGAPIIDPQVQAHVIVPIAPHELTTRPLVVPSTSEITIKEVDGRENVLVIDGQHEERIKDEVLSFTRSPNTARFIRFHENFYERVREKLLR